MDWIIPANAETYNHAESFKKNGFIDWSQSAKFKIDDIVYIYCTKPIQKIIYKTRVIKTDMDISETIDDKEFWADKHKHEQEKNGLFMRLELIKETKTELLSLNKLLNHGLKGAPQGAMKLQDPDLLRYIEERFQEIDYNKDEFKKWMETQVQSDGKPYTQNTQDHYIYALAKACSEIENLHIGKSDLFTINLLDEFKVVEEKVRSNKDFTRVNEKFGNGSLSAGMIKYGEFLQFKTGYQTEYQIAAKHISEYVSSAGFEFDVSQEAISALYQEFYDKFSPEILEKIPNEELLKTVFYTAESTNDSLCYWLEFHAQNKKCFGSIAGGSSFKFGLFQKKEDGIWITGSPNKPEELSEEDAVKLGREICDGIIRGAKIIESYSPLNSLEEYEKLDSELNAVLGKYAYLAWIHKYYCMIFPSKLATWHSSEWQYHMLYAYGIKPSKKYYARSGQLAIIANYAKMPVVFFAHASYDRFGEIKQFCRIGTSDGTTNYFLDWKKEKIVSIGWNKIESLANYVIGDDINKNDISQKLGEAYYPQDAGTASRKAGELTTFYRTTSNTVFMAADGESLLALGDSVGEYYYDSNKSFAHCKPITWHCCFANGEKLPNKNEGLRTSCYALSNSDNLLYLYHKYYYEIDEIEPEKVTGTDKRIPRTDQRHPLNQIIYGAPGTGKTYSTVEYAVAIIEKREIDKSQKTPDERKALMGKYESYVENGQITFTTFHQSYGYEEFIQGIRPDSTSSTVSFKKVDGIFKQIADRARPDTVNNYVIIIDEINRGNISKVFGELITLVEEDKRYGELNQLSITLPLGGKFTVPNNLYIIGTMNSADKSISLIDTALRRRFAFIEMAPDESIVEDEKLRKALATLNTYLKKELCSTDLLIGHSFFMGKSSKALGDVMNRNIIPLLYEYFYDEEAKVKKALECLEGTDFVIENEGRGRISVKKKV